LTERKTITVEQAARWAYRMLQVDVAVEAEESGSWSAPSMRYRLGAYTDCGNGSVAAIAVEPLRIHKDARTFHECVKRLPGLESDLVIAYGREGAFPEPAEHVPQPEPMSPGLADRQGQAVFRGAQMRYRIEEGGAWRRPDGTIERAPKGERFQEAVYRRTGKKRVILSGYREKRYEILSCPLHWWPSPAWYEMVCAQAEGGRACGGNSSSCLRA
jgi:hypothetical protein